MHRSYFHTVIHSAQTKTKTAPTIVSRDIINTNNNNGFASGIEFVSLKDLQNLIEMFSHFGWCTIWRVVWNLGKVIGIKQIDFYSCQTRASIQHSHSDGESMSLSALLISKYGWWLAGDNQGIQGVCRVFGGGGEICHLPVWCMSSALISRSSRRCKSPERRNKKQVRRYSRFQWKKKKGRA